MERFQDPSSDILKIRWEGWHALFHCLFHTVLVSCWLLSKYGGGGFKNSEAFRVALYKALFDIGGKTPGKRNIAIPQPTVPYIQEPPPFLRHTLQALGKARDCRECSIRPKRRKILGETSQNFQRKRSSYGCAPCGAHLCKEGPCFDRYHSKIRS
ncbi:hypothetical protein F5884DRAFT_501966 [Xylogone sp. PMI_703]|nr:hypothetical protein F5884DRAFT_501966 [Xylogone sp. PMI_703]